MALMSDIEKESKQAKRALEEAKKRHSDKSTYDKKMPVEKRGRGGLEPTRYGDWEKNGRCSDF